MSSAEIYIWPCRASLDGVLSMGAAAIRLARPSARSAMLRQCHSGKINARRDSIGVLTKPGSVLDFFNGYQETNNYARDCGGSGGTCRTLVRVDCLAAFGDSGAAICVGFGAQAHRGIHRAVAIRQSRPQGIGSIRSDDLTLELRALAAAFLNDSDPSSWSLRSRPCTSDVARRRCGEQTCPLNTLSRSARLPADRRHRRSDWPRTALSEVSSRRSGRRHWRVVAISSSRRRSAARASATLTARKPHVSPGRICASLPMSARAT